MNLAHEAWLNRLANLNVSKSSTQGIAPHKPMLLLSIIDMIEGGVIDTPWIAYSAELLFRFNCYWTITQERRQGQPDMRMPFHALGGKRDRIWECLTEDKQPSHAKETTKLCRMDDSLWLALQIDKFREMARLRLVSGYFSSVEQVALFAMLKIPEPSIATINEIKQDAESYKQAQPKGRDSRFRSAVLSGYQFTCALTGYRLTSTTGHLVEAAHIHQHAKSGDDDPYNGLALTPDAHWMFDRGLWTAEYVDNTYLIKVKVASGHFTDDSPTGRTLEKYQGRPLHFVESARLRPDPGRLSWHYRNVFLGR